MLGIMRLRRRKHHPEMRLLHCSYFVLKRYDAHSARALSLSLPRTPDHRDRDRDRDRTTVIKKHEPRDTTVIREHDREPDRKVIVAQLRNGSVASLFEGDTLHKMNPLDDPHRAGSSSRRRALMRRSALASPSHAECRWINVPDALAIGSKPRQDATQSRRF
jgi:hypothetical protein